MEPPRRPPQNLTSQWCHWIRDREPPCPGFPAKLFLSLGDEMLPSPGPPPWASTSQITEQELRTPMTKEPAPGPWRRSTCPKVSVFYLMALVRWSLPTSQNPQVPHEGDAWDNPSPPARVGSSEKTQFSPSAESQLIPFAQVAHGCRRKP